MLESYKPPDAFVLGVVIFLIAGGHSVGEFGLTSMVTVGL
jgi:hypothetical protein